MKKYLLILALGLFTIVSCGPSAKEIEEKRIVDSTRIADSICMVETQKQCIADSIAKCKMDSLKADSVKKCCKKNK